MFHIVDRAAWESALQRGVYEPASLQAERFIHCSTRAQVAATANRFYRGRRDLLLLAIDPRRLTADLRFEPPRYPAGESPGELFPHIYGPLHPDAVARVLDFPCDADGGFHLPAALDE